MVVSGECGVKTNGCMYNWSVYVEMRSCSHEQAEKLQIKKELDGNKEKEATQHRIRGSKSTTLWRGEWSGW